MPFDPRFPHRADPDLGKRVARRLERRDDLSRTPVVHTAEAHFQVWFYKASNPTPITEIVAEVASTPRKRAIGLSQHLALHPASGMLFLHPSGPAERPETFHVGGVVFPFDLIFIRRDAKIGKIVHNIQPDDPSRWSYKKASAVLEVVGGFCKAHGIGLGDEIGFGHAITAQPMQSPPFRGRCTKCGFEGGDRDFDHQEVTTDDGGEEDRLVCPQCGNSESRVTEFDVTDYWPKTSQATGTCANCGDPVEPGELYCSACHDAIMASHSAQNLNPAPGEEVITTATGRWLWVMDTGPGSGGASYLHLDCDCVADQDGRCTCCRAPSPANVTAQVEWTKCPKCGAPNASDKKCTFCGEVFEKSAEPFHALVCPKCGTNRSIQSTGMDDPGADVKCVGCGYTGSRSSFAQALPKQSQTGDGPWELAGLTDGEPDTIFSYHRSRSDAEQARKEMGEPDFPHMTLVVRQRTAQLSVPSVPSAKPQESSGQHPPGSSWDTGGTGKKPKKPKTGGSVDPEYGTLEDWEFGVEGSVCNGCDTTSADEWVLAQYSDADDVELCRACFEEEKRRHIGSRLAQTIKRLNLYEDYTCEQCYERYKGGQVLEFKDVGRGGVQSMILCDQCVGQMLAEESLPPELETKIEDALDMAASRHAQEKMPYDPAYEGGPNDCRDCGAKAEVDGPPPDELPLCYKCYEGRYGPIEPEAQSKSHDLLRTLTEARRGRA